MTIDVKLEFEGQSRHRIPNHFESNSKFVRAYSSQLGVSLKTSQANLLFQSFAILKGRAS